MVHGLLITLSSHVAEHGLQGSVFVRHGLSCPTASSWTRDQTHIPCTGRWILIHWTTREVPKPRTFKDETPGQLGGGGEVERNH